MKNTTPHYTALNYTAAVTSVSRFPEQNKRRQFELGIWLEEEEEQRLLWVQGKVQGNRFGRWWMEVDEDGGGGRSRRVVGVGRMRPNKNAESPNV